MTLSPDIRNKLTSLQYENGSDVFDTDSVLEIIHEQVDMTTVTSDDIRIYTSDNLEEGRQVGVESGFDGAALHIRNAKTGENEVYYIFRGTETENINDIIYDLTGIATGTLKDQLDDARVFYNEVESSVKDNIGIHEYEELRHHGDGHSLGGHLIVSLALIEKDFASVRGVNDAPVNLVQIVDLDLDFRRYLFTKGYEVNNIAPEELQLLARNFYADEAKNISHTRVRGEPLYPQTIPYTLYIGNDIYYIGDPNTLEFPNVFDSSNTGSGFRFASLISSPLGVFYDLGLGIKVKADSYLYDFHVGRLMGLIGAMGENMSVAEITEVIEAAKDNPFAALQLIPNAEYARLIRTFGLSHLLEGLMALSNTAVLGKALDVVKHFDQMDLHSMQTLIDLYNDPNVQKVLYRLEPGTKNHIKLNIGTLFGAMRAMEEALERKREALGKLLQYRQFDVQERVFEERQRIESMMSGKEANWQAFLNEEGYKWTNDTIHKPTGVTFRKEFDPINSHALEQVDWIIESYELEIKELESMLSDYKETMHVLFETDEELAALIR
ncbi:DUF6792 domain-containing protein [Shouchella patagoniensis]|uniref:DUF6792 domain-containing protein n=1 Tax=Shouchella patagoniensis TaxID=228576 RepID=UPI000994F930|nr:DUF6792 domain-containing protein [Shouchella patagoniensis]